MYLEIFKFVDIRIVIVDSRIVNGVYGVYQTRVAHPDPGI